MLLCAFVIKRSFCFSILTINTLQLVVEVVISCIYSEYMICLYKSRAVHLQTYSCESATVSPVYFVLMVVKTFNLNDLTAVPKNVH